MKDQVEITCDFQLGDARWLQQPEEYEVLIREPLRKSTDFGLGFLTQEHIALVVMLQQSGLLGWATSKAYDHLWQYLIGLCREMRPSPTGRKCSMKVKSPEGDVRAELEIENFCPESLAEAEIELKSEIKKGLSGETCETTSIYFKIGGR